MKRPWSKKYPGDAYNVIFGGNMIQPIFFADPDREKYFSLIERALSRLNQRRRNFTTQQTVFYHLAERKSSEKDSEKFQQDE